jgi:WD40 repeat protein
LCSNHKPTFWSRADAVFESNGLSLFHNQKMSTLFGAAATTTTANQANTLGDLSKDIALNNPPEDSISDLAFSPVSEHLAVASWDKKVRIYEISPTGQSEGRAMMEFEAPVLSCHWSKVCNHARGAA